jgi:hypothetical protein
VERGLRRAYCAQECAREHPEAARFDPTPANETKKNPSVTCCFTEGLLRALKLAVLEVIAADRVTRKQ